jgi:hypothetical protein
VINMGAVDSAVQGLGKTVGRAATATTQAAGAVGGAAVDGVIGGVTGLADGVRRGLRSGSRSTPAAAVTVGALGLAGLVEWPVLLTAGGAALLLRQLYQQPDKAAKPVSANASTPAKSTNTPAKSTKTKQPRQGGRTKAASARPARSSR